MKLSKLACCSLLCFAGVAHAQSRVTLYGVVDEFIQVTNTGKGYTPALQSSGEWGSRIGFRGTEEIGGGNTVNFVLEDGFVPNTGAASDPNSIFSRLAWIGAAGHWGEVRVGLQNSPVFITSGRANAFHAGTQAAGLSDFSIYTVRTANTLSYTSPHLAGFQASIYVGLGNAGGFRQPGSSVQYSLTYDNGPFAASYAAQSVWNSTSGTQDRFAIGSTSYAFGPTTVYLGYLAVDWPEKRANYRAYSVSAEYRFSPFSTLAFGGAYLRDRTSQDNDARQISALYDYFLSKRTKLYAAVTFLQNRNTASHTLVGAANSGPALAYPGADARGVQLGIVHWF